jgi:hypothetical protein
MSLTAASKVQNRQTVVHRDPHGTPEPFAQKENGRNQSSGQV